MYFDGLNSTNRILDVLQENRPKIMCIDELDKMPRQFQEKLLSFMESGHIKVDQMRKQYDFKIKGAKVFAACNEITRLSRPLQSRFRDNEEILKELGFDAKEIDDFRAIGTLGKPKEPAKRT